MSRMLFLLFVQSLFQFGQKKGSERAIYYGEKNYLDMSFVVQILYDDVDHTFPHC